MATQAEKNASKINELKERRNASSSFVISMNQTEAEPKEDIKAEEIVEEAAATVQEKIIPEPSETEKVADVKPVPVEPEKKQTTNSRKKRTNESENKAIEEVKSESKSSLLHELKAKSKKKRIEDTHSRCTFLVRKDLESRINEYADGNFGFKTSFINYAIEAALEDYDKIYSEDEE